MALPATSTLPGPTAIEERALGPDLTRAVMLWFIALANSHYFIDAPRILGGYPRDSGSVDSAVTWVISSFVDGRAFPLFGLLFGYGVAQQERAGEAERTEQHDDGLGLWAGRRRILERPEAHRRMLGVVAVIGIGAGVLGAQPFSLVVAGVVPLQGDEALGLANALHTVTGVLGGAGYAVALALLSVRLAGSPGRGVRALAATGQRSMTCYLAQSVVCSIAFTPFVLDLAGRVTAATTALLATATWLATVVLADRLARTGRRGPFEVLLRRATYGRPQRPGEREPGDAASVGSARTS